MCLINFQLLEHPHYKLIVAANRDEFYGRPTAAAHFWEDEPNLLAGRDLMQMGTWLGLTRNGRFAALTNYRDPQEQAEGKKSRGEIVKNYLTGNMDPHAFLHELKQNGNDYPGFNVIVGNPDQLVYYSNRQGSILEIDPGTHAVSNHFLNTPWPKVIKGKNRLQKYTMSVEKVDPDQLFKILQDDEEAKAENLPNTGIDPELERKLSPLFIKTAQYGTRSSTVLLIDRANNANFIERTYHEGRLAGEKHFHFALTGQQHA